MSEKPDVATQDSKVLNKTEKPTSYFQALVHLFKGNVGPGLFAMGFAFKHGGMVVSVILTIIIAIVCVHCQHILVNCSVKMRDALDLPELPDFASTVELCFENGSANSKKISKAMKRAVNAFICVTQLGFCCIYFVFIGTNLNQVLTSHTNIKLDVRIATLTAFLPIWLSCLITNLKYLTPVSVIASLCMIAGMIGTLVIALKDGGADFSKRNLYTNPMSLSLYFGTTIFAFEGIALVLPLKNSMAKPENFNRPLGVLNVGMFLVTVLFELAGIIGYGKWGDSTAGSLTLNLGNSISAEVSKMTVSAGVLFGYALQFHVAIQIMLPSVIRCVHGYHHQFIVNLIFRTILVLITLAIAELVPALGLFISLIGSLCSTSLALVFPPIIDLLIGGDRSKAVTILVIIKNTFIIIVALLGFTVGTYQSLYEIIKHFNDINTMQSS